MGRVRNVFIFLVVILLGFSADGVWAQPPTVVSRDPANNSTNILINKSIKIQFSTTMDTTTSRIELWEEDNNDIAGTVQWSTTVFLNDTLTFIPNNALKPATHYCAEGNGQSATGGVWFESNFITKYSTADATPPTVQTVYPYNEMANVSTSTRIYIAFSEAMTPSSVTTAGNITITGPGIPPTDYNVTYDFGDGEIEIKKNTPFSASSKYTVTITTNVKDLRGNWLQNPYSWSFTTGPADGTAPRVTQTIPASGDEKVIPYLNNLHVIFSEEMDESSLTPSNITLYDNTASTSVPINIYRTDEDYVTFGPQSILANNHQYTVTIGTGVKDRAGNPLSAQYQWSFITANVGVNSDPVINWGLSRDNQRGMRWSDGTTGLSLELGAWDDVTDPLTVTATTLGHGPWTLTKPPGEEAYSYESTGNEGLSSGYHTLTFAIQDGVGNTVSFQRNIFIFDASPVLTSPTNTATGISTTPTFQWSYGGSLRPTDYGIAVFDGPDPDTARMVWIGWMVDNGASNYSITIPKDKQLAPNTTYYWGVMCENWESNGEAYSELLWSFTTGGTPPPEPSFASAWVRSDDQPTGMHWNMYAKVAGPSPADIVELKVTGPGGFRYIFTEDNIIQSEQDGLSFWRDSTSSLANGLYTFTVTDSMGRTATSDYDFTFVSVPRVDSATMSPVDNFYAGTTTPTLSWGSVVGSGLYYRVMIMDWNGLEGYVYLSPYISTTEITVPSGYLLSNTAYKWRVEVFDSSKKNRAVSNTLSFSTEVYPYTLDLRGYVWSDNTYYGGNRKILQPVVSGPLPNTGPLPNHVNSLIVTGPGGFNHPFTQNEIRWAHRSGNAYVFGEAGFPADGTWNFLIVDTFGSFDSYSKDQTSVAIPIVDYNTLSPANNAYLDTLTPTFTWAAVAGSPRYYRVAINDWREKYTVYWSSRSTDLYATIPGGVLKQNRSYKWRVEVFDDPDGFVADNRSSSMWYSFTTVPPPCEGDFDGDGDVDVSDMAIFAAEFGRTDCKTGPPCKGDFDNDGDVDGSDLAVFAADFGRTNCPR